MLKWEFSFLLQTEIIRKRLHKDIPHHSVIMLNFCPDLQSVQPNLRKTRGEFIFLIDRSGSMNGTNIQRVKVHLRGPHPQDLGFQGNQLLSTFSFNTWAASLGDYLWLRDMSNFFSISLDRDLSHFFKWLSLAKRHDKQFFFFFWYQFRQRSLCSVIWADVNCCPFSGDEVISSLPWNSPQLCCVPALAKTPH